MLNDFTAGRKWIKESVKASRRRLTPSALRWPPLSSPAAERGVGKLVYPTPSRHCEEERRGQPTGGSSLIPLKTINTLIIPDMQSVSVSRGLPRYRSQ